MTPLDFIHRLAFEDLPPGVVHQTKRALLDLVGVAFAGTGTELSRIARRFAANHLASPSGGARILFDGRRASAAGAAYAGASTIDAFDAHDGHALTKGHAGVALLPALLAVRDAGIPADGRGCLTALVLGYEIATRAGIALHKSVGDYHTSGAWNALGVAAMAARLMRLGPEETRHAIGIAEYHGPRSQMMRVIDHPTMLKDGSGWGAFAGVAAADLAADGFTGAPAVTLEAPAQSDLWHDLGERWRILEQYFKPYPVCRWAQPAIEAAASLLKRRPVAPERIAAVEVETFAHAVRLGNRPPATTEEAQYAIGFPLAAFLVRGRLGAAEIGAEGLADEAVRALCRRIALQENESYTRRFPAERLATLRIVLDDGTILASGPTAARGDPERPLSDDELVLKFRDLTSGLDHGRRDAIERAIWELDGEPDPLPSLVDLLLVPA